MQVSGLRITYDLAQPEGRRLVSLERNGQPVADSDSFTIAVPGFVAEGGDLYDVFAEAEAVRSAGMVSDLMADYFASHDVVTVPSRGRQVNVAL